MSRARKPFNPFYVLVLLSGVAFTVTACAYGWMIFVTGQAQPEAQAAAANSSLLPLLREHGTTTVLIELGVLVVSSIAAMATDRYWSRLPPDHSPP